MTAGSALFGLRAAETTDSARSCEARLPAPGDDDRPAATGTQPRRSEQHLGAETDNGAPPAPGARQIEPAPIDIEFISVPDWCRRVGSSLDAGYRAARRAEIVGLFRIGRLMRINWPAFVTSTALSVADGDGS